MTPEEARIIAWTILGEAAGEGPLGMTAVAHVIRNRSLSGRYPSNPASVAIQGGQNGYYQFSAWNPPSKEGNSPRSRYAVGSPDMNRALEIVAKVFSPTPGNDPTQGATHYYSTSMKAPPYWWSSEAPKGGKQIGNHIFAVRHDGPIKPSLPVQLPADLRGEPIEVRTNIAQGEQVKLPQIFWPPVRGMPEAMPEEIRWIRENNETPVSVTKVAWDPVGQELRKIGTSYVERNAPAKKRQIVAGFSVPPGTVERADITRELTKQGSSFVERNPPKKGQQTVFGPNTLPKTEERLPAGKAAYPGGTRSRDSIAARDAGNAAVAKDVLNMPPTAGFPTNVALRPQPVPVRVAPVQQPQVVIAQPQTEPLRITVTRDTPGREIVQTATGKTTYAGYTYDPGDGYTYRVERDGSITNTDTGRSSSDKWYNPDTNQFERRS